MKKRQLSKGAVHCSVIGLAQLLICSLLRPVIPEEFSLLSLPIFFLLQSLSVLLAAASFSSLRSRITMTVSTAQLVIAVLQLV